MLKSIWRTILSSRRKSQNAPELPLDDAAQALRAGDFLRARMLAEAALKSDPDRHAAWNLLGAIALQEGDDTRGCQCFDHAAMLSEDDANYHANAGEAYRRAGHYEESRQRLHTALRIDPTHGPSLYSLAMSLAQQWRADDAFDVYRRMLAARPEFSHGYQGYLFFLNFYRTEDPQFILSEHRRWAEIHADPLYSAMPPDLRHTANTIPMTIGYVSADFNRHAVGYFIEPILRYHDREQFRIHLYSNGSRRDASTERIAALADRWYDISRLDDDQAVALMRRDKIDVLVDLSGHTAGNRLLLFARRAAPVQATYLGYPSGTGMRAMDYRITDAQADSGAEANNRYVEKLLYLPDGMWCYAPPDPIPPAGDAPSVTAGYMTFGSLNHVLKITPRLIALWARLLMVLPTARLIMAAIPQGEAQTRIAAEFSRQGVDPKRVRLMHRLDQASFWALHREIDIALDSFPCNGGTTSCETLWLGVPVLTLVGGVFLSRVGLSLLSRLSLTELTAWNDDEFIAIAVQLAGDAVRLSELRRSLRTRMLSSPLTDAPRFAHAIEAQYAAAWRERRAVQRI